MPLSKPFYAGAVYEEACKRSSASTDKHGDDPSEEILKHVVLNSTGDTAETGTESKASKDEETLKLDEEVTGLDVKCQSGVEIEVNVENASDIGETSIKTDPNEKTTQTVPSGTSQTTQTFSFSNIRTPPASNSLMSLSLEVAQAIEVEEYQSAMDLLEKTLEECNSRILTEGHIPETIKNGVLASEINESTSTLDLNPEDVAALQRRALAYSEYGYFEEAFEDIVSAAFLESLESKELWAEAKNFLEKIAKNEADKLTMQERIAIKDRVSYAVPSHLDTFVNDLVTLAWKNAMEEKKASQSVEDFFFPTKKRVDVVDLDDESEESQPGEIGYKTAVESLGTENFDRVLQGLTEEIFKSTDSEYIPQAQLIRGTLRHLFGYCTEALTDYDAVIANPNSKNMEVASAWIKKGLLLAEERGSNSIGASAALLCFAKSLLFSPKNADAYFAQAHVHLLRQNDIPAAAVQIDIACTLAPEFELYSRWKLYLRIRVASERHSHEGIDKAFLEFDLDPELGLSDQPEVLRVDICILAWMGRLSEAHLKLDRLVELEPEDPRVYLGKLLLHEIIYNDPKKNAFGLLQDTLLNYGQCAGIHEAVGQFAFGVDLFEAAAECIGKSLTLTSGYDDIVRLVKLEKTVTTFARVVAKFGLNLSNYPALQDYKDAILGQTDDV